MNGQALTPEDIAILDAESSTIAGHTCKAIVVEGEPPTLEQLRAHVACRLDRVPRCRQRLEVSPRPVWVDDPAFSIDDHVRMTPDDSPSEGLPRAVARAMSGRLERNRALWDLEVVPRLDGGRWAIVWRVHHCMADGMTMMRWATDLFWDDEVSSSAAVPKAAVPAARPPSE